MAVINNWLAEFLKMEQSALTSRLPQIFGDDLQGPTGHSLLQCLARKEGRELAEMVGKLPLQNISQSFYSPFSAKGKDPNIS